MAAHPTLLTALADPTRRLIVERLRAGPHAVGEIARVLPVSRPAVSQHLAVLKASGLVAEERHGRRHIYRLRPHGLAPLRSYVEQLWDDALAAYGRAAQEDARNWSQEEGRR